MWGWLYCGWYVGCGAQCVEKVERWENFGKLKLLRAKDKRYGQLQLMKVLMHEIHGQYRLLQREWGRFDFALTTFGIPPLLQPINPFSWWLFFKEPQVAITRSIHCYYPTLFLNFFIFAENWVNPPTNHSFCNHFIGLQKGFYYIHLILLTEPELCYPHAISSTNSFSCVVSFFKFRSKKPPELISLSPPTHLHDKNNIFFPSNISQYYKHAIHASTNLGQDYRCDSSSFQITL